MPNSDRPKTPIPAREPTNARDDLMNAIKGPIKLKKVTPSETVVDRKSKDDGTLTGILADALKNFHVANHSDSDDTISDDEDWSDE